MALQPEDRYASPRALADDIEHWLADEPVSAYREPWPARLAAGRGGTSRAVAAALMLLTAVAVANAIHSVLIRREQQETERQRERARTGRETRQAT